MGDKNTAFFHSTLKAKRNKNRVESICNEEGVRFEGDDVPKQFVNHFEKNLGVSMPVKPILEDIFRCKLSEDEAESMINEVTD